MEEYLSGLSEQYSQYSALQQMLGQAAITQQLQTAMQGSQSSGNSSLALAQYMQQVQQQVQLATAVSAASSGSSSPSKPLSSMLSSMAMLQNMSSVSNNYAQAQAMMSMMMTGSGHSSAPKRGRGSRGTGSSPRGRKLGLKLKRLESGEYVPGAGRGRGARGGTGVRGRKNTDYMQLYMQVGRAVTLIKYYFTYYSRDSQSWPVPGLESLRESLLAPLQCTAWRTVRPPASLVWTSSSTPRLIPTNFVPSVTSQRRVSWDRATWSSIPSMRPL